MLGRIALRMATVEALKGATLVGSNVLDSEIGALDIAADGSLRTVQDKSFISVYVEGAKLDALDDLRALHRSGPTELMIETGISAAMMQLNAETGAAEVVIVDGDPVPTIPGTDAALEFYLDLIDRQVVNALTDPRNEWAEIWRGLSSRFIKLERRRTSDASNGTRVAAHQLLITVDPLPDPVFGEPVAPTSIWKKLFDKLATDTDPVVAKKRAAMLALLGDPETTLNSEAQRRRFGMTLEEVRALFDIAVQPAEASEPSIASVITEQSA